jgi:hypothetical protein
MYEPTTAWDRAPTDKELENFYGKPAKTDVRDSYFEVLTESIRKVPAANLALVYYSSSKNGLAQYSVPEVVTDYGTDPKPLEALLAVLEKSDCPLVQKYREALAEHFADRNADEVEYFKSED